MINFTIENEVVDQTLISFLKKRFKTTPLSLIYKLFRSKKIQVDGKSVRYYHHRLKAGERITIHDSSLQVSNPNFSSVPKKSQLNLSAVYEDQNLLIVRKEHGVSMPELDKIVQYYFYQQNSGWYQELKQKYFSFTSLHRLDKLTQGLVIYPKNPVAKRLLYNLINDKEKISKKYLAVCENNSKKPLPSHLSGYLWKNETEKKMEFSPVCQLENAKSCRMEIEKNSRKNNYSLLEITLQTGRKHQIRAALSFFGRPIIGDKKYGSKIKINNKIYLFAYKILIIELPSPLSYLNGKIFQIKEIEKQFNNFWR